MKEKKRKKPNIFLRVLTFLFTLALIAGALVLVVYRDELNLDALKRYVTYRTLTRNDAGQADSFPYIGSVNDAFADLDGSLLVAGGSGIRLYSPAGTLLAEEPVILKQPMVSASGKYAVVYDAGGTALRLYSGTRQLFAPEKEQTVLSATVNSSGWLAITHQSSGHKGSVSIYDEKQSKRMQFNFSSRFVMDAMVSEDNATLSVITIGQSEEGFCSYLSVYDLNSTLEAGTHYDNAPLSERALGNCVALALDEGLNSVIRVAGDNSMALCPARSEELTVFDYDQRHLKAFTLSGDGGSVLLLGKYQAGSAADLLVVNDGGEEIASMSFNEQVLSLSAAGKYIGVLTADRLDIYTFDLTLYTSLEGTEGARRVLMRPDGSATLIGSETAHLYLPA